LVSGRKGAPKLMWDGMDVRGGGRLDVRLGVSDSLFSDSQVPREMDRARDGPCESGVVAAVERGDAGFSTCWKCIALTAISGDFILSSRMSAGTPMGLAENRLRFPLSLRGDARGVAGAQADVRCVSLPLIGLRAASPAMTAFLIARAFAEAGSSDRRSPPARPYTTPSRSMGRVFRPHSPISSQRGPFATMCVGNIRAADQINDHPGRGRAIWCAWPPMLVDPAFG